MTRLLAPRLFFPCVFAALVFTLAACGKEASPTVVNGRVVDKVTGEGVAEAKIDFQIFTGNSSPNDRKTVSVFTDSGGTFSFSHENAFLFYDVHKEGYLPKDGISLPILKKERVNEAVVEMVPQDVVLNLVLKNQSLIDTIFIVMYSPTQEAEYGLSHGIIVRYPFSVPSMSTDTVQIGTVSGQTIDIYWDFNRSLLSLPTYLLNQAAFHDSVSITQGGVAFYEIDW